MMETDIYLSVVIPVYNEESRIIQSLEDIFSYLRSLAMSWEVLIVDDGSHDRTAEIIEQWIKNHHQLMLIRLPQNCGKGAAIRQGMLKAQGRYRLFRDADVSTAMAEFDRFRPILENGTPIVIGSRKMAGAKNMRRQPWLRETLGKGFTLLSRLLFVWEVSDYTCGFKCFSAKAAEDIFSRQKICRWAFDSEIVFLAKNLGYPIAQLPITWTNDPGTKVRLIVDVLNSFFEIICIRLNYLRGLYRIPQQLVEIKAPPTPDATGGPGAHP